MEKRPRFKLIRRRILSGQSLQINFVKDALKEHIAAEKAKLVLAYFHVISPNATKYTT